MHTNVSELRLFVGIVNLYVRCFTYLFIVQTTWERPSVALDERKWQGFLDGGNYHYIRWGTYSLWSTLATLLCDLNLPEWPRSYFAPYQAWWEEDKSLKYIRLTLPLRESKTSHKREGSSGYYLLRKTIYLLCLWKTVLSFHNSWASCRYVWPTKEDHSHNRS